MYSSYWDKIQAIKDVREITGWGIRESKDFVDMCSLPYVYRTLWEQTLTVYQRTPYRTILMER